MLERRAANESEQMSLRAKSGMRKKKYAQRITNDELSVLRLMAYGFTREEMLVELGITRRTLQNHYKSIFSKLNVANRMDAVCVAMQRFIIS